MTRKTAKPGSISRRRLLATASAGAVMLGLTSSVGAQQPPIKIGMSMPQTGGLAGGGKASLLGIEIWRDDVNAKGGLLGRKVELVVYDDKSSASETPAIYSKLLDVDKVDLLFGQLATLAFRNDLDQHLLLFGSLFGHDLSPCAKLRNYPLGPSIGCCRSRHVSRRFIVLLMHLWKSGKLHQGAYPNHARTVQLPIAPLAELVDAPVLKTGTLAGVWVRIPQGARIPCFQGAPLLTTSTRL